MPIGLRPGESAINEFVLTETSSFTTQPTERTKTYAMKYKYEFLGIEDVTLGDGTVVRNACKVRTTTLANAYTPSFVGNISFNWLAAGWGDTIRSEEFDKTGKLLSTETIIQVIAAP